MRPGSQRLTTVFFDNGKKKSQENLTSPLQIFLLAQHVLYVDIQEVIIRMNSYTKVCIHDVHLNPQVQTLGL